jgi:predicted DNA-binding transcriptional regulator YafY
MKASSEKRRLPEPEPSPDERILSLMLMLLGGDRMSREEIFAAIPAYVTRKSEAGERKFERDKKELRELGVSIEEDADDHTYAINRREYELPELSLDDEEREVLVLAASAMRSARTNDHRDLVENALRKLAFDRFVHPGGNAPTHLAFNLAPRDTSARFRRNLAALESAIEARKRVTITYGAGDGKPATSRAVDPYGLAYRAGDWQLVGYCHLRKTLRTFRVDRIRSHKPGKRPDSPDFSVPATFSLSTYLQRSPWLFEAGADAKRENITLEIAPERAWVADENFGETARRESFDREGQTWTRITFLSANPEYVVSRALDAAGFLRVVTPKGLRKRIHDEATRIAVCYELPHMPSTGGQQ